MLQGFKDSIAIRNLFKVIYVSLVAVSKLFFIFSHFFKIIVYINIIYPTKPFYIFWNSTFQEGDLKSPLLKNVVTEEKNGGQFPNLQEALDFFEVIEF